ncbi:uncharacterized protein QC763_702260 [Podospora pseudopauciseta]|uniref:Uncharacterized protein n=1 Tax=Podospora pseudopauciseta TaxID=2093780 RepID=A0ABR0H0M4_9PEZI|nr:hypothetical protein QC763_702260 [Podospora pseudopauciseta]
MAIIRIPSISELDFTPPATPSSTLGNGKLPSPPNLILSLTPPSTPQTTMSRMDIVLRVRPSLPLDHITAQTRAPSDQQIPSIRSLMASVPAPSSRYPGGPFTAPPSPSGSFFSAVSWNGSTSRSSSVERSWMSGQYSPPLSRRGSSDGGSTTMTPSSERSTPEFPIRSGRRNSSRTEPYSTKRVRDTDAVESSPVVAGEAKKGKRSNQKYTTEQQDFIIYHREDLTKAWKDIERAYIHQWPAADPQDNRKITGVQCIFYRQNLLVPLMNNTDEKLLVLDSPPFLTTNPAGADPKNSDLVLNEDYAEYVVYKGVPHRLEESKVRTYGRPRLLLERSPEELVEHQYDWLPKNYLDAAQELASKRDEQRWRWLQQYGPRPDGWIDSCEPIENRFKVAEGSHLYKMLPKFPAVQPTLEYACRPVRVAEGVNLYKMAREVVQPALGRQYHPGGHCQLIYQSHI